MNQRRPFVFRFRLIRSLPLAVLTLFALCALPFAAHAQTATATLSGTVEDEKGAVVPGATVAVLNVDTSFRRESTTNDNGSFLFTLLPPGHYSLTAERQGFKIMLIPNITLNVGDQKSLQVQLQTGNISETVRVEGEAPLLNESPAVATTIDRTFVGNLPLNGRSFQSLIGLTPGVVISRADFNNPGQFNANGQRADANYFLVDGVSANTGINAVATLSQTGGGTSPPFNAAGGTNSIVSMDAMQEFKIQTSTFAPEFGRTPGAQVQIITRSGSNELRGTVFEYFRNDALDANDWFANSRRQSKPPLRQNNFGVVLGGPVYLLRFGEGAKKWYSGRDRTFFFFSYEGNRLRLPQTRVASVPSVLSRQNAPTVVRPLLNAYPVPNGNNLANGFAEFTASYSDPATINATSLRIDHQINDRLNVFGRYNHAPSNSEARGIETNSLNVITSSEFNNRTFTIGSSQTFTKDLLNELRFNYTVVDAASATRVDNFGGATTLDPTPFLPSFATTPITNFAVRLPSAVLNINRQSNRQRQYNLVDNLSLLKGTHQLKFGVDYRTLSPEAGPLPYTHSIGFSGLSAATGGALSGIASNVLISAKEPASFSIVNFSVYGQDSWRISSRLLFTYGLRWDLNPPPKGTPGHEPYTFDNLETPAALTTAPRGTPLYATDRNNFAPRAGFSYQLSQHPNYGTIMRGGFGVFYDLGYGAIFNALSLYPFSRTTAVINGLLPLTQLQATPAAATENPPFGIRTIADRHLRSPYTYQWNFAVEQSLGKTQTLTASYVGAAGRQLLRAENLPPNPAKYTTITVVRNTASSDYKALQLQFQRRLSAGLQAIASYTWSESLDNASNDSGALTLGPINPNRERGPSDFDVRHLFSGALTYQIPYPGNDSGIGHHLLSNWFVDALISARSGFPVNVFSAANIGFGVIALRPDVNTSIPLYLYSSTLPGGRRFNPAAFTLPPTSAGRQGSLPRNALRGFGARQFDVAIRRQFRISEKRNLQLKAEFFNVFNHPNFGDPSGDLSSGNFGISTQMLGRSLGTGGSTGGFSPLFQLGGPRSIQLVVRFQF